MQRFIFIILYLGVFVYTIFTHPQPKINSRIERSIENDGYNGALIAAAKDGHEQLVELLIQSIANISQSLANINAADEFGDTALHAAAYAGRLEIVRLLVQSSANSSIRNNDGKKAKDLAIEQGFNEVADLLGVAQRACNLYTNSPITRIFGDEPAVSAEFPWMVALGYVNSDNKISYDCGATIISDSFLLTAAHCVEDDRRPVLIRVGKLTLSDDDGIKADKHYIERIIQHPRYSQTDKKNDIALIQLVKRIYFSRTISPACLQTNLGDEAQNVNLTVSGWGGISKVRVRSDTLLKANLTTMPLKQCNTTILKYGEENDLDAYRGGITDSQYCAHDPNGVSDGCVGESGGPLQIIQGDHLSAKVVGVVSFSIPVCGSTFPTIYTRVASYVGWIESHVWPNDEILAPLINFAQGDATTFPTLPRISLQACDLYSSLQADQDWLSRIFFGVAKFPWAASLGYLGSDYKINFQCEGTLISDSFILTAAHCLRDRTRNPPVVVQLKDTNEGSKLNTHLIKAVVIHPDYSVLSKKNDIALIELTNRITFSPFVKPACLQTDVRDEDPSVILTETVRVLDSKDSNEQSEKELRTVPLSECNTTVLDYNQLANLPAIRNGISEGQYCANRSYSNDGEDSCMGDSGGAIQIVHDTVPATVVGIVSFVNCGGTFPSIYTRVAYYLDWIESVVWPNGELPIPLR